MRSPPRSITTERLILRRWRESDREPFAELNRHPEVMEFLPKVMRRAESDDFVDRIEAHFEAQGWGLWAVEVAEGPDFIGYVGLWPAKFEAPFTPAVEVGWRLDRPHWGKGYATEAARAAIADGFTRVGVDEIVSFTAVINFRSQRVMERVGMRRDPADDFDHPALGEGDPLRPHVLYRLPRPA